MKTLERTEVVIDYVADDGTVFSSEKKCISYEDRISDIATHGTVWIASSMYKDSGNIAELLVFSTEKLARRTVPDSMENDKLSYGITRMNINERFYDELRNSGF